MLAISSPVSSALSSAVPLKGCGKGRCSAARLATGAGPNAQDCSGRAPEELELAPPRTASATGVVGAAASWLPVPRRPVHWLPVPLHGSAPADVARSQAPPAAPTRAAPR
eukprot:5771030-Alexandrium_andersonii.AAC.1